MRCQECPRRVAQRAHGSRTKARPSSCCHTTYIAGETNKTTTTTSVPHLSSQRGGPTAFGATCPPASLRRQAAAHAALPRVSVATRALCIIHVCMLNPGCVGSIVVRAGAAAAGGARTPCSDRITNRAMRYTSGEWRAAERARVVLRPPAVDAQAQLACATAHGCYNQRTAPQNGASTSSDQLITESLRMILMLFSRACTAVEDGEAVGRGACRTEMNSARAACPTVPFFSSSISWCPHPEGIIPSIEGSVVWPLL